MITKGEIVELLIKKSFITNDVEFGYNDDFIAIFKINSLNFMKMVVALEDEYDIEIPDIYLGLNSLSTINTIYSIINTK